MALKKRIQPLLKRELFVLLRIVAGCLAAVVMIFCISSLSGEDILSKNSEIKSSMALVTQINGELDGGIAHRLGQLGQVPDQDPSRKFYAVALAKEIHELSGLTEKQRMLFETFDVRNFEMQLQRMMAYTENSDVKSLMDELEIVRRELRNSANLMEKKSSQLTRQRTAYIVLFVVFWGVAYLYFSRRMTFRKPEYD
jgi:hypothetical protein